MLVILKTCLSDTVGLLLVRKQKPIGAAGLSLVTVASIYRLWGTCIVVYLTYYMNMVDFFPTIRRWRVLTASDLFLCSIDATYGHVYVYFLFAYGLLVLYGKRCLL